MIVLGANLGDSYADPKVSCSKWGDRVGKFRTAPAFSRILKTLQRISVSPLDFSSRSDDTSDNSLAAPLLYPVMCPHSDVHHWRVSIKHKAQFEPNSITAAPPLLPLRHNAVIGRLLLFGDLQVLEAGGRR